jgi:HlyD family secretion protein
MDEAQPDRAVRRPSFRLMAALGAAVVVAAAVGWRATHISGGSGGKDKDAAVPPLVTVVVPSLGNVSTRVSLTGQIGAQNDMPIGVEGDGGRIAAVLAEPGDHVRRGQVLARLNPLTAR